MTQRRAWNEEQVRELLNTRDDMVYRSLGKLYERQTQDEQRTQATNHHNGIGFTGADARLLTDIWQRSQRFGRLTPAQTNLVRRKLQKYVRQLTRIANEVAQERGNAPSDAAPASSSGAAEDIAMSNAAAERERQQEAQAYMTEMEEEELNERLLARETAFAR